MNAFLQLLFSPRHVKVTPVERTPLTLGEQLPLTDAGRSFGAEAELQISPWKLARVHGRIARRDGKWRLSHSAEDARTLVNGAPEAEAVLEHLDVLELPDGGPVFRFLTSAVSEGASAQVTLDEPARLAVWADGLMEANDPLGDRIARRLRDDSASHPIDDLRWLGPLARTFVEARLEVEWRHGMLRGAVLRDLEPVGREPLRSLELLLRSPVARFLEELTIDAGGAESNASAFIDVLRYVGGPRSLRRLNLGEVSFADAWAEKAELAHRKSLEPLFPQLDRQPLFGRFRRALLTVERASAHSRPGEQRGDVQELGDSAELIDLAPPTRALAGPIGVAFWRLQRKQAHWELEAVPPSPSGIKLNGKPVLRAALRDGDQIELSTGVSYRFHLER